jgi:predicted nucleic acid-binding protein
MSPAAFLDANVFIYASGRPHPLKAPCAEIVMLAGQHPGRFVTDAEVLQELLHRLIALRLWAAEGRARFRDYADLIGDRAEPMLAADVRTAALLADRHPRLSARDLVHLAVMARLGVRRIVTADSDFDGLAGIERLDPARIASWREALLAESER